MAHLIDTTTGRAAIAFAGSTPWHGLGQSLTADAPLEVWQREAGLDWRVIRAAAMYGTPDGDVLPAGRDVLFRSDTKAPLGVVSKMYHEVQPDEVMGFFRDLVDVAGFKMEVAGAIKGGQRIWALARVNADAVVRADDVVAPYVLLSTSFDGSASTVAQFTTIRVVCNNTLSAADRETNASRVSVWHNTRFDANKVKADLGIVATSFGSMMERFRFLSDRSLSAQQVDQFLFDMFKQPARDNRPVFDARKSRGYQTVMNLFEGAGMGANMVGTRGRAWGLLNAVTEYVDHHAGRGADGRLESAWFGKGDALKRRAFSDLLALVA